MTNKEQAIQSWINEMNFDGEKMVVTKDQTREFLSEVLDVTHRWGEANRAIGVIQGVVAVSAGFAAGALIVIGVDKLEKKFKKDDYS